MSTNYENAVATRLLATQCAICGRPLVDAISIERGLGPECRKDDDGGISPEVREQANKIVHDAALSAGLGRISEVLAAANAVEALGLTVLAGKMRRRFQTAEKKVDIEIIESDGYYRVTTPYRRKDSDAFVAAWRAVPGRRWVNGANVIPVASKTALWGVLRMFFGGRYAKGPNGMFRIPKAEPIPVQRELNLA